jgi:hypothetical protein
MKKEEKNNINSNNKKDSAKMVFSDVLKIKDKNTGDVLIKKRDS